MDRLRVLQRHLAPASDASDAAAPVAAAPTAARGALPTVDASVIERVLDPDPAKRAVKAKVNALFAGRPDLLVPHVEGLRKGEGEGGRTMVHGGRVARCLAAAPSRRPPSTPPAGVG